MTTLRELRDDRGLSQQELGDKVGLSYVQIGRIERGDSYPSPTSLKNLAKAFGLDRSDIVKAVRASRAAASASHSHTSNASPAEGAA